MWKKSLLRGIFSYFVSVTFALISGLISLLCGAPSVCVPSFIGRMGGEVTAALMQTFLLGLVGFSFGASSVLFEIERWSFLKQGAAHFALTAMVWIPVELFCFSFIPPAVLSFTISAAATYIISWTARYFTWRAQVRRLNEQIHLKNKEDTH